METLISQLKKDFYSQLSASQSKTLPHSAPTLSLLTAEELLELETAWVQLNVWKKNQLPTAP
ncbi:hypothetical protein JCM19233_3192 [Vibrio astriarenae]|uniref:3-demethylubiquinone-9 3-methyltransferase n=1 Tax=Vibrio astriarenae TaxID=1481923 RepID=A0A7Z2T243_9VIBR|nr:hypothetical protein GT360_05370 [Vibrio astriarenae]GAL12200.1 hypothetical protein JCM19233_3192 [Vibrio sp. C7]